MKHLFMCQCPKRATPISTYSCTFSPERFRECVNALSGLLSFLPDDQQAESEESDEVCQCPKRATLISTNTIKPSDKILHEECQCPKRATLISTYSVSSKMIFQD